MALRYRALLLTNWEYGLTDAFPPLKGPRKDADVLRQALTDPAFGLFEDSNVVQCANVTNAELSTSILEFLQTAEREDYLLIYYSGHGGLRQDGLLALCGIDTRNVDATAFRTDEIAPWIRAEGLARPTVLVLDCCFAGQVGVKSGSAGAALLEQNLPDGLVVLASSGRVPSRDATEEDTPSPFTEALASILLDPTLAGTPEGFITETAVVEALRQKLSDPKPRWKIDTAGMFPLARRPRAASNGQLSGWREDQHIEVIDAVLTADGIRGAWSGQEGVCPFAAFDGHRRWAIRRLTHLADGVMRQREADAESMDAVRRAWQCVGENLFQAVLPEALQQRFHRRNRDQKTLLKLRLSFDDRTLEDYPWEYLRTPPLADLDADQDQTAADGVAETFGHARSLLVERAAPPAESRSAERVLDTLVINAYRDTFGGPGERVVETLGGASDESGIKYLASHEATWIRVANALEGVPRFLVLSAPLMRRREDPAQQRKSISIGFARYDGDWDWQRASALMNALRDRSIVFDCVVLVTYAVDPGRDSYRAVLNLASLLARSGRGPVAFVCHERAYQTYVQKEHDAPSFPGLLIKAIKSGKPVDRAFMWARNRIIDLANEEVANSFGVPGLYMPQAEELVRVRPAAGPSSSLGSVAHPRSAKDVGDA